MSRTVPFFDLFSDYIPERNLRLLMVEVLIDYILVGKRQPGEPDPPVEIHWNF